MRLWVLGLLAIAAGCGSDELRLANKTSQGLTLNLYAPKVSITGGCSEDFGTRFCAEEYEPIGTLPVQPLEERLLTVYEGSGQNRCVNLLWVRVLDFAGTGPVADGGSIFRLPALAEVEAGAGKIHTVAFPEGTIRVDEVGTLDENQRKGPPTCAELGRDPR
ncbi:MAG: hypothetical protein U1E65_04630 [Myxococcota bacterium]